MFDSAVMDELTRVGATVSPLGPRTAEITMGRVKCVAHIITQRAAPSPQQARAADLLPPGEVALYLLKGVSLGAFERLRAHPKVWVVAENGAFRVGEQEQSPSEAAPRARGRVPWGRYALMRVLLRTSALRTQQQLAAEAGITQGTTSLALAKISGLEKVPNKGWRAARPELVWDAFMQEYPGARGVRTHWHFGVPVTQFASRLDDCMLLSADAAANVIAPWRLPVRTVGYLRAPANLEALGLVPAVQQEANVVALMPEDKTVFSTATAWGFSVADPIMAAWDIGNAGGDDAVEAVEVLRGYVLGRLDV